MLSLQWVKKKLSFLGIEMIDVFENCLMLNIGYSSKPFSAARSRIFFISLFSCKAEIMACLAL